MPLQHRDADWVYADDVEGRVAAAAAASTMVAGSKATPIRAEQVNCGALACTWLYEAGATAQAEDEARLASRHRASQGHRRLLASIFVSD